MALDDFMDIDTDPSESDTKSQKSDSVSKSSSGVDLSQYDNFHLKDGKLVRRGLVGFDTMGSWDATQQGDIKTNELLAKFWYPIFPHTGRDGLAEDGKRYKLKVYKDDEQTEVHTVRGVTCYGSQQILLKKIPREVVMLDTGEYEKQEALDTLSNRLGHTVGPEDTVTLYHFASYKALAQTAIVNTNIERFGNKEYAMLTESALREGKLSELRREFDEIYITDIPEW